MTVDLGYIKASDGTGEAVRPSITAARSIGATTLQVDSIINLPEKFIATTGTLNLETEMLNPEGILVFLGHLDGANIAVDAMAPGYVDTGNSVGQVVLIKPTSEWADMLARILEVAHNDDGTLNSAAITSILGVGNTAANLRLTPRLASVTSTATLTPAPNTHNQYEISALETALLIDNPSAGGVSGDIMIIQIKDNGTSRAITYGNMYSNVSGLDSLTATTPNKWHTIGFKFNLPANKWQIVSISTEA